MEDSPSSGSSARRRSPSGSVHFTPLFAGGEHGLMHRPPRRSRGSMTALFTATGSVDGDDDDGEVPDEVAIVTDVNINSVLENPRERTTLLDDVWSAEPDYVLPPCAVAAYAKPPSREDFEPYLRRIRHVNSSFGFSGTAYARSCVPQNESLLALALREEGVEVPLGGDATSPVAAGGISSRAIVPPAFFREDFDLRDPDTFHDALCSSTSLILHHKARTLSCPRRLSVYLDAVEDEIARHVRTRADDFVSALNTLQVLETNVSSACSTIDDLRGALGKMKRLGAQAALKRLALQRRRLRLQTVREKLAIVQGIRRAKDTVAALVRSRSYISALDAIDDAEAIIARDLLGVHAVAAVHRDLLQQRDSIGEAMVHEFVTLAVRTLSVGAVDDVLSGDGGGGGAAGGDGDGEALAVMLETTLKPLVEGLARVRQLENALDGFQKRLVARGESNEIKTFLATNVTESLRSIVPADEFPDPRVPNSISRVMEQLPPASFLQVLNYVMDALLGMLQRARDIHELVERVLDVAEVPRAAVSAGGSAGSGSGSGSAAAGSGGGDTASSRPAAASLARSSVSSQPLNADKVRAVNSGVTAVVNTRLQSHVAKFVSLRSAYHAKLKVDDIVQLLSALSHFGDRADSISGGGGSVNALRTEVGEQAKQYLAAMHAKHMESLNRLLDAEQWRQAEVPAEVQSIADMISSKEHSSAGRGAHSRYWNEKELVMDGHPYKVVSSCLMLVKMLGDHYVLARGVPLVAGEAMTRMVELLRLFNTRSTQLILKAGALKTAGLKMISSKHLALCSQCLAVVRAAISCIRAAVVSHLHPQHHGPVLGELDKVAKDYTTHSDRIINKIVSIVMDLTDKCCAGFDQISWNEPSHEVPSAMMKKLIEGMSTLHKLMIQSLHPEQLESVFCQIAIALAAKIPVVFSQVAVSTLTTVGKDRIAADVRHLLSALRRYRGLRRPDEHRSTSPILDDVGEPASSLPVVMSAEHSRVVATAHSALESMEGWMSRQYYGVAPKATASSSTPPLSDTSSITPPVEMRGADDGPACDAGLPERPMDAVDDVVVDAVTVGDE